MPTDDTDHEERLADALGSALQHATTEALIIAKLEEFFSPKPVRLTTSKSESDALDELAHEVTRLYGGVPRVIIQGVNDPKPKYDTYLSAAIDEAIEVFSRARRSLCRAQTFLIGAHMLKNSPDLLNLPDDPKIKSLFQDSAENVFWEHTETTFIRLAGFWDRLGQILDFAFFSIRQYERDGFSAVVDRIRLNTLRMRPDLAVSPSWLAIWSYKRSEHEDGLQWLLSRRNMLVHSLHLRPVTSEANGEIFESAFNHLDTRLKRDLAPGTPEQEIQRLHVHLSQAASLLPQALTLCKLNAEQP